MIVVEGIAGYWHYHISKDGKAALCGNSDIMNCSINLTTERD